MPHRLGQVLLGAHACSSLGEGPQSKIAGSNFKIRKDICKLPLGVADPIYIPNGHTSFIHFAWFLLSDLKAFDPKLS